MTKEQLKALIKECVCEVQQSLEEKKHKLKNIYSYDGPIT